MLETEEQVACFWQKYYPIVRAMIRERVRAIRSMDTDESDVALSALHTFISRAQNNEFPHIEDDSSLWQLLKTIAVRKVNDCRKRAYAAKRGGLGSKTFRQADTRVESGRDMFEDISGDIAQPGTDLEISELFNDLFGQLVTERERDVVLLRLQGASFATIAEILQVSTKTVQRTLSKIEDEWTDVMVGN